VGFASSKPADALVRSLIAVSFVTVLNDSYIGPPNGRIQADARG